MQQACHLGIAPLRYHRCINTPAPPDPEEQFRARLDALERDARAAARFAFIGSAINAIAAGRPALIRRLDEHAGFWNSVLGALQTAAIVALGRIYDSRRDVHSADHLLSHAERYPGIFGRTVLAARISTRLNEADTAEYVRDAFEPSEGSFADLRQALDEHIALYEETVRPIRNKVFAHTGPLTPEQMRALFAHVPIEAFEKLSVFPLQLWEALWQLYMNGRAPVLLPAPMRTADVIAEPVGQATSSWEHRHAVRDISDFLEWLDGVSDSRQK